MQMCKAQKTLSIGVKPMLRPVQDKILRGILIAQVYRRTEINSEVICTDAYFYIGKIGLHCNAQSAYRQDLVLNTNA